ncbi:MAG TPA: lysylphosphatidylglycerol synthase transmembrane domain-containing protein [Nitrososphaerales archaeon]|nr:lysylphosphatidylglycerol synthase transmembrane domain-containing protein [Nitrososphaerales archaeon]
MATDGLRLSKSAIRWSAVGLVVSSSIIIAISIFSGVTVSDLARLGYVPFALAAALSAAKLLVQVGRFRVLVTGFTRDSRPDLSGLAVARIGSEFVALSTPASIGGEFLRAAWLSGKGVVGGKAVWIGYYEVVLDVYVSGAIGLVSAAFAFSRGATLLASTILVIVLLLVVGYSIFFLVPAFRGIPKIPGRWFKFAGIFIGGPRATRFEKAVQEGSANFSRAAREILRRDVLPTFLLTLALTIVQAVLSGAVLWIILNAAGLNLDLTSSILVAYGATAIAALPISIGGSGLTELAVSAYLSTVYGLTSWPAVVLWRVASYQVILVISGIAFLLLVRKATRAPPRIFPSPPEVPAITP